MWKNLRSSRCPSNTQIESESLRFPTCDILKASFPSSAWPCTLTPHEVAPGHRVWSTKWVQQHTSIWFQVSQGPGNTGGNHSELPTHGDTQSAGAWPTRHSVPLRQGIPTEGNLSQWAHCLLCPCFHGKTSMMWETTPYLLMGNSLWTEMSLPATMFEVPFVTQWVIKSVHWVLPERTQVSLGQWVVNGRITAVLLRFLRLQQPKRE